MSCVAEPADLLEAAFVDQPGDALTGRELALGMLFVNPLGATSLFGPGVHLTQLL